MASVKGRYQLLDVLGQGGMGVVYRAVDNDMRREVALKTIRDSMDRTVLDLFRRECAVLASLNHPNIVDIYDIGEFEEGGATKPYFVMPLLPGAPLSTLLASQTQRLTPDRVIEIMTQTLRGLQAAHEKGLVHRDLKPSNLFVLDDDSVKIIDFGVAHLVNTQSTVGLKGTLYYMAPEQLEMQSASALSDIFTMGVVCYEALTRRRPFSGNTHEELVEAIRKYIPPAASEINPAVNSAVSQIVHAAMAKQPWHRFSSAREFAEALQKAARNQPIERFDPSKIEPRLQRAKLALGESEYEFASEILNELESQGYIHSEIRPLRKQIDQATRNRTIRQLLESAERRLKDDEYQLALEKLQQLLQIDPANAEAQRLKTSIETKRSSQQIENWMRIASEHLDNFSFSHAREALQKVMQIKPGDARALQLLDGINRKEQSHLRLKREKEQHYQAALECWRQGDVTSALSQVERLMELDREAPDRSDVEKSEAYQELFNKVRSEHEELRDAYEQAKTDLSDGNYAAGLAICDKYLEKYPQHALFQSLKLDIGESQRQAQSAYVAKVDRQVQEEPDLDRKVGMLEAALSKQPGDPHFEQALKAVSARRAQINSIVARAQNLEERGQYAEALNQWEMLRTVYRQYPGLDFEVQRLERRKEVQAQTDRKNRVIEQADAALKLGDFSAALRVLQAAKADFPDDAELAPMEKLAQDGLQRLVKAEGLIFEGQRVIGEGDFATGLQRLEEAYALDERSSFSRAVLLEALLQRGSATLESDPCHADTLVSRALKLDPANAQAKSLRLLIADRKRDAAIGDALSKGRYLQAEGQVENAEQEIERALREYPEEPRLIQLRDTLHLWSKSMQPAPAALSQPPSADVGATRMFVAAAGAETSAAESITKLATPVPRPPVTSPVAQTAPPRPPVLPPSPPVRRRPWGLYAALAAIVLLAASAIVYIVNRRPATGIAGPISTGSVHVRFSSNVSGAKLNVDRQPLATTTADLKPGPHTLTATLDGYQPLSLTFNAIAGQALQTVNVSLLPAPAEIRVTSDLSAAQLVVDGVPTGLQSGAAMQGGIAPGDHSLQIVADGRELVAFHFTATPGASVGLGGPIASHNIPAVVISSFGNSARVWASPGLKGGTSEDSIQPIPPDGLNLDHLDARGANLLIDDSHTGRRTYALEAATVPTLRIELGAERATGTIVIHATPADSTVVISGTPLKQPMTNGTRLLSLAPNVYQISVTHAGFEPAAEQTVDLRKGDTKTLTFQLVPSLRKGVLAISKFPAQTDVSIDGSALGTTDKDGVLRQEVASGPHTLTFHKPGYDDVSLKLEVKPDKTESLAGDTLMPALATVTFKLVPPSAKLTYRRDGDTQSHSAFNGQPVSIKAGAYTASAEAEGFSPASTNFHVVAGGSNTVPLTLTSVKAPTVEKSSIKTLCADPTEWNELNGWWQHNGSGFGWFRPYQGKFTILFLKQSSKVFFKSKTKRIEWAIDAQSEQDRVTYWLDEHLLHRQAPGAAEVRVRHEMDNLSQLRLQMEITPEKIVIRDSAGKLLDEYKRPRPETPLGKFGVHGEVALTLDRLY